MMFVSNLSEGLVALSGLSMPKMSKIFAGAGAGRPLMSEEIVP
jgi:hypothetical protein